MFQLLPDELQSLIVPYLVTSSVVSVVHLRRIALINLSLWMVTKGSRFQARIVKCRETLRYLQRYGTYQYQYCFEGDYTDIPNPIILDMLSTGLNIPYARSSFSTFDKNIQSDLHAVLRLIPSSVNSTYGHLRCRSNVTPLYVACINEEVPLSIVQLLIDYGADTAHSISLNGESIGILDDIQCTISSKRFAKLVGIFCSCQHKK